MKKKTPMNNGFIVRYNRQLLSKYRAHINVELCNQNKSIKYLFKYVNKGHDRATTAFYQSNSAEGNPEHRDEIKIYYDCRYLSACEVAWRLFSFDIYYRDPPVIRLPFHLPDSQMIVFNERDSLDNVLNRPSVKQTMFLAWFEANKKFSQARKIRYAEFPQYFVYKEDPPCWEPRKQGFSIGRVTNVPPNRGEDYYLRLLLNFQRGCTSYEDIRTIDNVVYPTYKDACYALGLLDDDKEYVDAIKEAYTWATGDNLRRLFAVLLLANSMSRPKKVWECCCSELAEDIAYRYKQHNNNSVLSENSLLNLALIEIEKIMQSNGKSLRDYPHMPFPNASTIENTGNKLIADELAYDIDAMQEELQKYLSTITDEQKKVFHTIMDAISKDRGGLFFLYGHIGI